MPTSSLKSLVSCTMISKISRRKLPIVLMLIQHNSLGELLNERENVVVTWGFGPDCERSVSLVLQLRSAGFKWIWFDGNRPAALREFQKRATVQEIAFYVQMYRIENSRIVERLKPIGINSFDDNGQFKAAKELLAEIRATSMSK